MMWKLFHWLLGWDFVCIEFGGNDCVRRVKYTATGRPYANCYGHFIWLDRKQKRNIIPLTFEFNQRARGEVSA